MNGVRIRPVRVEDAEMLNELRRQPGVMEFTLGMPSERIADNQKYLESLGPDDHVLVAEAEGRVVGIASLHVAGGKRRHVGHIGIAVHDDFQNRGIGRSLMQVLLDLADNYLGLVRAELEVQADNPRAIHLYESLGFEHEGRKRKEVFRGGRYVDHLIMGRLR